LFVPFSNSKGAFSGTIVSLLILMWIFIGANVYGVNYPKKPVSTDGCNITNSSSLFLTTTTTKITTAMAMIAKEKLKISIISALF
jgi:hypothetical protein